MSKAVDIIDGVLFVHTRHYNDVNRVIICHQKKPLRVFSDDAEKELGRPHGEWIEGVFCHFCSECHNYALEDDNGEVLSYFCPNCGADMRKEGEQK